MKSTPISWVFWHPHQKLWNKRLIQIIRKVIPIKSLASFVIKGIIYLDTKIYGLQGSLFSRNVNKRGYDQTRKINYFDIGTHKKASELRWVVENVLSKLPNPYEVLAFEANPMSFEEAKARIGEVEKLDFMNVALVHEVPESGHIQLYIDGDGLGDSIYRKQEEFIEVEAKKLSAIIKEKGIDLEGGINVLRMNIEGCEFDVIKDLAENDLIQYFTGFFGMWDDVSKIDLSKDKAFRKLLRDNNVYPFPFNGRDMRVAFRMKTVRKSFLKSIVGPNVNP